MSLSVVVIFSFVLWFVISGDRTVETMQEMQRLTCLMNTSQCSV